ncbi:hypothetical protein [Curtobacterium sp. UCD-KPL2560]|uniref:hypothetical protein n=2 Tax=unclassified Curtobacterium TaxID=257496 RepID=UPI00114CDB6D|nr:hypothetical protein [Curtobacterium sp. UCD-KPL2560]
MPWFKIDDGFWSHPKTLQLSDGAQALWVRAGSWCMAHLTDGVIPSFALPVLGAKRRYIDELVGVSLWIADDGAYRFHDWEKYQPTRESVEADRDAAAERKRRSREKSRQPSRRDMNVTDGVQSPDAAPSPTRPDPTRPTPSNEGVPRKRASRIPEGFAITDDMRSWARAEVPLVNVDAKLAEFVDYWVAVPGQKGVKTDWISTWRNGMRKQQQFAERDRATRPAQVDRDAWMNA